MVAKYRPSVPILVCCDNLLVIKQLCTSRGMIGFKYDKSSSETLLTQALTYAKEGNLCKSGRKVIYLHGMMDEQVDKHAYKEIIEIE